MQESLDASLVRIRTTDGRVVGAGFLVGEQHILTYTHIIFSDVHPGKLYAGDVVGVRLPRVDYVRPPTPPPDLDLEAWSKSMELVKSLRPDVLYIGHFGAVRNAPQHFERLREKLYAWGDFVLGAMRDRKDEAEITRLPIEQTQLELKRAAQNQHALVRYESLVLLIH